MGKVYALLIGIDSYPEGTRSLEGCVADVANVEDYLTSHFTDPAIIKLTNTDATNANVIAQIRQHLGQAGKDDVAYLHYSGHGSRSPAALEFNKYDRDLRDQTLVCYDSRIGDNYDLTDKELALLIEELAQKEPHIAWLLDCCHSGTGTRDLPGARKVGVRGTGDAKTVRTLDSYLEGQYATRAREAAGTPLIPQSRHMLLAACDKDELAKEDLTRMCGIFTHSAYDILRETGGDLSYAELFGRARVRVSEYIRSVDEDSQRPQFETVGGFDGWQGFLGRARKIGRRTYVVGKKPDGWSMDAGAVAGLPVNPAKPVTLALSLEATPEVVAGTAHLTGVSATRSTVEPDFAADPAARYLAVVTSLPDPALRLRFAGDAAARAAVYAVLNDGSLIAELADDGSTDDGFLLSAAGGQLVLARRDDGVAVYTVGMDDAKQWGPALLAALAHIAQWRRLLALHNPAPQLDPAKVEFSFVEQRDDGTERVHPAPALTLDIERRADRGQTKVAGEFRIRNLTGQALDATLFYFADDYSVQVKAHNQIAPSAEPTSLTTVSKDGTTTPRTNFWLPRDGTESVDQLRLVLTTEPMDTFLLPMDKLEPAPASGGTRVMGSDEEMLAATRPINDDWFTIPLTVRLTPRLAQVGLEPATLAGGQISIAAHGQVTASLALVTPLGGSRGAGAEDGFTAALARAGIHPAQLNGGRGDAPAALDITDISHPEALAEAPLQLSLKVPLAAGEVLLPMVRDGAYLMPAGEFWRDEETGTTHLELRQVPTPQADQRSLGSALRLYLFKSVLGIASVNKLRLVSFDAAGKASYSEDGVIAAVKGASRVLVTVHGIIGDTAGMCEGLHAAGLTAGFDCVLAYDYENLATAIDQTARVLKADLAAKGLTEGDGKQLTIVAHSMGGLVSRWLIEKEGGGTIVDHLVMCGTPNEGSAFGQIATARKVLTALMMVGANFGLPVCAAVGGVLSATAKLTPTLEQMGPGSDFITALNAAPVAATRYTILAGDIEQFEPDDPAFFAGLMDKIYRSAPLDALQGTKVHDIAVKTSSIRLEDVLADHPAARTTVACHHLNYFSSPAGQAALKAVVWS